MEMIKNSIRKNKRTLLNIAFLLPALVLFAILIYYPLISSLKYSVTDWNMTARIYHWVGFDNYKAMFKDKLVLAGMKNTVYFTLYTTLIGNALALFLALALDSNIKFKKYLRAAFYLPCLLSPMVVSAVFGNILQYHGILNELLHKLGLDYLVNDWFSNQTTALPLLIVLNAWQWAGYGSIIYLAGLQTISLEFYEAARIDGAGPAHIFIRITLPLLMSSITIMTFLSITGGLKLFDIPFVLMNGGPGTATQTLATVIYTIAFQYQQFGFATAISVVLFIVIAILSILQIRFTRKREVEL
jgi:raffinose/stachyose/melibiose transport system permease protein